jgi:hypothetical protein
MHSLVVKYEESSDTELLRQMRFHSRWDQCQDSKTVRLLRAAANRIEELKSRTEG